MLSLAKMGLSAKIVWICVTINLFLWLYTFWQRGDFQFNGFHFYYEPLLVQILFMFNLPALLITGVILTPLIFGILGVDPSTEYMFLQTFIFLVGSSLQWVIIGYVLEVIYSKLKPNKKFE